MGSPLQAWDLGVVQHGHFIKLDRTHSRAERNRWLNEAVSRTIEAPDMEKAYHERWDDGCKSGCAITASRKEVRL